MAERPPVPIFKREYHPADSEVNFNQLVSMIDTVAGGLPTYPVLTTDIASVAEGTVGEAFTLTVAEKVIDGQTITYKWQKATTGAFADITGATSATLTIASWAASDNGKYRCAIINTVGAWTATIYSNVCVATTATAS